MSEDNKKVPNEKVPNPSSFPYEKQCMDLPWDTFLGRKAFSPGVLIFSFYFKRLGMPQMLTNGDWYYTNIGTDEAPNYSIGLYVKNSEKDDLTFEDLNFLSSGKYVRIPTLQELLTIIMLCGYNFTFDGGLLIDVDAQEVCVQIQSDTLNNALSVKGKDVHEALLQAAYYTYLMSRNVNSFASNAVNSLVSPMSSGDEGDTDGK